MRARGGVAAVDRQAVVVDDGADRLGDLLQDSPRIESGDELLADVQEPPLGGDLVLEQVVLALQLLDVVGVDDGLGGVPPEDRESLLVVRAVPVDALPSRRRARPGPTSP